ncbi:MAG TPA: ABC transporter ATP-binding protein [Microbacteriaceae bacterium]|nr:ABC transporter ATP-binding protein [Microbacteriaceae bacterium]
MSALPLKVSNLSVSIDDKKLLHEVSFDVAAGERVGFIGGSGSGKTLTALAISGLLPESAKITGSVKLDGKELIGLNESELAQIRGELVGMVFQEPKVALNPLRKLGNQMTEALDAHYTLTRKQRHEAALNLAVRVGLKEPSRITNAYPHEVSGGQRQRAAIAAAISANPGLLLADEPTTALDVTVQQGVIELFRELTTDGSSSLVFITHDLAVLTQIVERIYVFHEGKIVESGSVAEITTRPISRVAKELILAAESETTNKLLEAASFLNEPWEKS